LSLGLAQCSGVNLPGRNSDHDAVSGERTLSRECRSPVVTAAGCLSQTVSSQQTIIDTAVRSRLTVGNPQSSEMLDSVAEKRADGQSRNVKTTSPLDSRHAVSTGRLLDRPSRLSNIQCPVRLNGISNADKSAGGTCSGMYS